jgi:anaerobic selenocysteine-containing dehydrogenase
MTVPSAFFRKAVLEEIPYPVKAAYMQCCNPLMAYSDSRKTFDALLKLDFIAISDIVMTPTALFADIVLPAATQFEFNDIGHYGIGHGYILARPKVVDPPKDCLPDMQILNELGRRLTDPKYWHDNFEQFLEDIVSPSGLSYSEFAEKGYLKGEDRFQKYLTSGFSTPTGKVELKLSRAEKFGLAALPQSHISQYNPEFPLILTSCKDPYYLHSSYRWIESLRHHSPKPMAKIHPDTAKDSDIRDGKDVCIETHFGKITQTAEITEDVMPGVVYAAYGWWFPENSDTQFDWQKSNYNMLTSSEIVGQEFGTPNLKGVPCRIYAISQ